MTKDLVRDLRAFLADEAGFNGAEKALLVCVGLSLVLLVGKALHDGANKAANDAKRFLEANPMRG